MNARQRRKYVRALARSILEIEFDDRFEGSDERWGKLRRWKRMALRPTWELAQEVSAFLQAEAVVEEIERHSARVLQFLARASGTEVQRPGTLTIRVKARRSRAGLGLVRVGALP